LFTKYAVDIESEFTLAGNLVMTHGYMDLGKRRQTDKQADVLYL
jgi:hypothetical protein